MMTLVSHETKKQENYLCLKLQLVAWSPVSIILGLLIYTRSEETTQCDTNVHQAHNTGV